MLSPAVSWSGSVCQAELGYIISSLKTVIILLNLNEDVR